MTSKTDVEIAISGAAQIDYLLYELLMARLQGRERVRAEVIEAQNKRAKLAFCMGLLTESEYEDWRGISYVRNAFAHDWPTPTFESGEVIKRCRFLSTYEASGSARFAFGIAVSRLADSILGKIHDVAET